MKQLKMKNVVAIAICLATLTVFASCVGEEEQLKKSFVGKWVTSDLHAGDNDTIVFKENFCVEKYFDYITNQVDSSYIVYSLSEDEIIFTVAYSYLPPEILEYIPISATFEFILENNNLTIKKFSNPFGITSEVRSDVTFKKIK